MAKSENRVLPMKITDPYTGEVYVLEFSVKAYGLRNSGDLKSQNFLIFPRPIFLICFLCFRKNHKNVSQEQNGPISGRIRRAFQR